MNVLLHAHAQGSQLFGPHNMDNCSVEFKVSFDLHVKCI